MIAFVNLAVLWKVTGMLGRVRIFGWVSVCVCVCMCVFRPEADGRSLS